ncbi:MAG: CAP domain-containing protein, partial [Clostridia bacterium]|nr:CAP domain-containing protein [Clostridia bacterium]
SNEEMAMDLDPYLTECAMQRAKELAIYYSHTRPDGTAPETVADEMGYDSKHGFGENVGYTEGEDNENNHAQRMVQGWYDSIGHRENMLNDDFDRIGIGCFEIGGVYYWVQLFDSNAGPSKAFYQKTGIEKVVANVRTNTNLLNLQVRSATYVENGETLPYRVIHMPTSKNGLEISNLVGFPLAFAEFDTGVKDKTGKVVANVAISANNITLNITQNAVESGTMTYKIASEQKNAVSLTVHGKEPHRAHNYFYGGCFVHPTYSKNGYNRWYCFCGAYTQEEIPKLEHEEEYTWQDRVNMMPTNDVISFQNQKAALAEGTGLVPVEEMGTTDSFNLIAPEGGATVLLFMEFDCHKFPMVKQLLSDLTTAGWLDDPRLKIMAVNTGGALSAQFKDVVFNYAGSYINSIQWYDNGDTWLTYLYSYAQSTNFYPGNSPWCAIFQNEGTLQHEGYDVCTLPAYTMKYFDCIVTKEMLENTLDYMFPGIVQQNETFAAPQNELWNISFEGTQHNDYVYEAYDLIVNLRDTETGWSDEEIAMDLDAHLTECAMQRAKELA